MKETRTYITEQMIMSPLVPFLMGAFLMITLIGGMIAAVMKLKLINAKVFSLFFRLYEFSTIMGSVYVLETLLIDLLYRVSTKAGDLRYLLIRVSTLCKQVTGVLMKSICNKVTICLKGDKLALRGTTLGASELVMRKEQPAKVPANTKMANIDVWMRIDMHSLTTGAASFLIRNIQSTTMTVDDTSRFSGLYSSFGIMKAIKTRWQKQKFSRLRKCQLSICFSSYIIHDIGSSC